MATHVALAIAGFNLRRCPRLMPGQLCCPPPGLQARFKSTVQLVQLPTVLGIAANEWFKKQAGPGRMRRWACTPVGRASRHCAC